jgi:hypothetical protein
MAAMLLLFMIFESAKVVWYVAALTVVPGFMKKTEYICFNMFFVIRMTNEQSR